MEAGGRVSATACAADRSRTVQVLIVERHAVLARGLQLALAGLGWDVEASTGPGADDVIDDARRLRPSCVLLDVDLGGELGSGIDLVAPLVETGAKVVMLTGERRRAVLAECIEAGADGWIRKGATLDEVDARIRRLVDGGTITGPTERAALFDALRRERDREVRARSVFEQLTHRELVVLAAITEGLSAEDIAREHVVALTTVRSQIRAVLQKLGVRSQLAAVAIADVNREFLPDRGHPERDRRRRCRVDADADLTLRIA